jgi:hypothetical protein
MASISDSESSAILKCDIWFRIDSEKFEVTLDGGAKVLTLKNAIKDMSPQFNHIPITFIHVRTSEGSDPLDHQELLDKYKGQFGTETAPFVVNGPTKGITSMSQIP